MIILSIDPGYERLGVAILEKKQGEKEVILFSECFKTSKDLDFYKRLQLIGEEIERVIIKYNPTILSIENLFFQNNQKTAMNVAEVRGGIILTALRNNLEIYEYTPLQIKSSITGSGRADKKQMMDMLPHLIQLPDKKMIDDEYDAIAIGLTFFAHN